jgi:hypothetical protein
VGKVVTTAELSSGSGFARSDSVNCGTVQMKACLFLINCAGLLAYRQHDSIDVSQGARDSETYSQRSPSGI